MPRRYSRKRRTYTRNRPIRRRRVVRRKRPMLNLMSPRRGMRQRVAGDRL